MPLLTKAILTLYFTQLIFNNLLFMSVFAIVALAAYSLSLGLIIPSLVRKDSAYRRLAVVSATLALVCHAVALYQRIFDVQVGQNLSLLNIGSLISLMICTIMTIVASRNRGWFLLPIVYTFALLNLVFASFMPGEFITHLEARPGLMVHIGLALFSYATLMIAALYALQLAFLDYLLKTKKLGFATDMPPLLSIERKMFHITQVGVVLLTLTLCTGLVYMNDLLNNRENFHKALFSLLAWFVYILLLWGHYHEGWRGRQVVWFNLIGALLLTLAYFGSRVIQNIIAH